MTPNYLLIVIIAILVNASLVQAESKPVELINNPFNRPELLLKKSTAKRLKKAKAAEIINLDLTATLVSGEQSMVIIDGLYISIGDSIKNLKLIEVRQGVAIFSGNGRKYTFRVDNEPHN